MPRGTPDRDQDGFTLLELVVCLGLLALMTALMAEGVSLLRRGSTVLERVEAEEADRTVEAHLRRTLERAVPLFVQGADNMPSVFFRGEPDRLSFVSRADGRLEGGGLVLVEFRGDGADGVRRLVTERRALRSGLGTRGDPVHLLVEGIEDARFRYYGPPSQGAAAAWSSRWTNPGTLPQLVELTVARSDKRLAWPPLVVAIPAAAAATN